MDHMLSSSPVSIDVRDSSLGLNFSDNSTAGNDSRNEELAKLEIATLAAIFVSILIGNVPIVITIIFGRLGRTRMYYFLLHLCIADLITGFFNVVPQLAWEITHHFHGGNILCKAVKYLQILGPYLSSYILMAMSVDRFQAICFPLSNNHLSLYRAKRSIALAYVFALLFCLPQAFIFSYQTISEDQLVMECWATFPMQPWGERFYVTWYALSVFIVPFIVITFTNFRICWELWRTSRRGKRSHGSDACGEKATRALTVGHGTPNNKPSSLACAGGEDDEHHRAQIKSVKLTVTVILCYIVCSLPFICVQLWAYWWPNAQDSTSWTGPIVAIVMLLPSLNSCTNPWIYLTFNTKLYKAWKRLFLCKKGEESDTRYSHSGDVKSF